MNGEPGEARGAVETGSVVRVLEPDRERGRLLVPPE